MASPANKPPPYPDFESPDFLRGHVESILGFYAPHVFDAAGGFFQHFNDDGSIYDFDTRHLVSSTRFVFNYANAFLSTGKAQHRDYAAHGFEYLASHHRDEDTGHYIWQRKGDVIEDGRAMAYGHAFVMLAAAWAARLDIENAREVIADVFNFMEKYFWDERHNAYGDERDASLQTLIPYRGQNANMHATEALIAAYETTQDKKYLNRAETLAQKFCFDLPEAGETGGLVWEHYDSDWRHDWEYNKDKPDDLFKPWGYQPGHQVEWAKLLLQLDALAPDDKYLTKAQNLFDTAMQKGLDDSHGGLVYGFAPDGSFADAIKYFWVQAEGFAAAWRLYARTGEESYRAAYHRLWEWSWDHLIDHTHGGWYRIVSREGKWLTPHKSPAGKVDYHTMGACWDVLAVMGEYTPLR